MTLNNASMMVWSLTNAASNTRDIGGSRATITTRAVGDNMVGRVCAAGTTTLGPAASSSGCFAWSRTDSANATGFINGVSQGAKAAVSDTLEAGVIWWCGSRNADFSTKQIAAVAWGGGLTDAEQLNLYLILYDYLGAIGAVAALPALVEDDPLVFWQADPVTRAVVVSWAHGDGEMRQIRVAAQTANNLPTITNVRYATLGVPKRATWTNLYSGEGDWWTPLIVRALSGGDGSTSGNFTGGNHRSNGDATGTPTAFCSTWGLTIDGVPQSVAAEGYAELLVLSWTNYICAYNTVSLNRYVLQQSFVTRISAGGVETTCTLTALEGIEITREYSTMMATTGFRDWTHLWGGQQQGKIEDFFPVSYNSGDKTTWPTDLIIGLSGDHGFTGSWNDGSYGIGDGSGVGSSDYRLLIGNGNPTTGSGGKAYQQVIGVAGKTMSAAATYNWRGGWFWSPLDLCTGDVETAFRRTRNGVIEYCAILPEGGTGTVRLRDYDAGGTATINGSPAPIVLGEVEVSSAGYGVVIVTVTP
jgi:hypothetical protein